MHGDLCVGAAVCAPSLRVLSIDGKKIFSGMCNRDPFLLEVCGCGFGLGVLQDDVLDS